MSWNGVKKQSYKQEIKSWCEEIGIKKYTINSQGEIDVDGIVDLSKKDFKELPYKFGIVKGYFDLSRNKNLRTLKNCPNYVNGSFACDLCPQLDSLEGCPKKVRGSFWCEDCPQLDSLERCPKEVKRNFWCRNCKRKFTNKEVRSLCKVKGKINV